MKIDFVIGPLELPDHPDRTAHGGQHPEKISSPVGGAGDEKQTGIGEKRHNALHQVAEVGQCLRAARQRKSDKGVDDEDAQPNPRHPDDFPGEVHTLAAISLRAGSQVAQRE